MHCTHYFWVVKWLSSIVGAVKNCKLPPDPGPCEAFEPSWFFNSTTGVCAVFIYGGCQGNGNRFTSYDECQASCHGTLKYGGTKHGHSINSDRF